MLKIKFKKKITQEKNIQLHRRRNIWR